MNGILFGTHFDLCKSWDALDDTVEILFVTGVFLAAVASSKGRVVGAEFLNLRPRAHGHSHSHNNSNDSGEHPASSSTTRSSRTNGQVSPTPLSSDQPVERGLPAEAVGLGCLFNLAINRVLKNYIFRSSRPTGLSAGEYGFPSGHSQWLGFLAVYLVTATAYSASPGMRDWTRLVVGKLSTAPGPGSTGARGGNVRAGNGLKRGLIWTAGWIVRLGFIGRGLVEFLVTDVHVSLAIWGGARTRQGTLWSPGWGWLWRRLLLGFFWLQSIARVMCGHHTVLQTIGGFYLGLLLGFLWFLLVVHHVTLAASAQKRKSKDS